MYKEPRIEALFYAGYLVINVEIAIIAACLVEAKNRQILIQTIY